MDRRSITWSAALTAVAAGLCFVPLVGRVGFEFSLVMTPFAALAGAHIAIHSSGLRTATRRALAVTGPPLALMALNGLRIKVCDWGASLAFYALLPGVGAAVGAAWGRAAVHLTARPRRALLWVIGAGATSLIVAGWRMAFEPPIFSYDPVFGMWPGALYDEALGLPAPLAPARLTHLLGGWAALAVAHLVRTPLAQRSYAAAWAPALVLVTGTTALLGAGPELGFRHDRQSIARALGRRVEADPTLTVLTDRHIPPAETAALVDDIRWRRVEIAEALGRSVEQLSPLQVYVFRTAAQRRRLMGADRTAVARPWLGQAYLVRPDPGEILVAHELVHALTGPLVPNPSGMPWRGGPGVPGPAMGLVEGLAVALAGRDLGPGLHEAVAGMRAVGLDPSPASLISSAGFYAQPSSRAYTVAGSFLRFMLQRRGPTAVRTAYASGQVPPELQAQWSEMISGIEVTPELRARAELLYRRGAIYQRVCPHEVAVRKKEARRLARTDPPAAVAAWESIIQWDPGDPAHLLALARAHLVADDLPAATAAAGRCVAHEAAPLALQRSAQLTLADVQWLSGEAADREVARGRFEEFIGRMGRAPSERLVRAKAQATAATRSEAASHAVRDWLLGRSEASTGLLGLQRIVQSERWALPAYLVARRLYGDAQWTEAASWFGQARQLDLGDPLLAAENLRLLGRAAYRAGQPAIAAEAFEALEAAAPSEGYAEGARSWRRRLAWLGSQTRNAASPADVGAQ